MNICIEFRIKLLYVRPPVSNKYVKRSIESPIGIDKLNREMIAFIVI